jgi:hypothetical protein
MDHSIKQSIHIHRLRGFIAPFLMEKLHHQAQSNPPELSILSVQGYPHTPISFDRYHNYRISGENDYTVISFKDTCVTALVQSVNHS